MAIPIRLLAGLGNEIEIDLVAQSIDMSVDRNVSAFPTPDNYLKRFAIDTNIPRVKIDINGIFVDDIGLDTVEQGGKGYPASMMINCASILPTTRRAPINEVLVAMHLGEETGLRRAETSASVFYSHSDHNYGATSTIIASGNVAGQTLRGNYVDDWDEPIRFDATDTVARVQVNLRFDGGHAAGIAPTALDVESSLKIDGTDVDIDDDNAEQIGASALLYPGARIIKSDGTFLGIVASTTNETITFEQNLASAISDEDEIYVNTQLVNEKDEFVGYVSEVYDDETVDVGEEAKYTIKLVSSNEAHITAGARLGINTYSSQWNSLLHNEKIKIIPSYWLENPFRNPKRGKCLSDSAFVSGSNHIGLRLILDTDTLYTTAPTLVRGARNFSSSTLSLFTMGNDAMWFDAKVNIPVQDITTGAVNPAVKLAQQIEAALNLEVSMIDSASKSKSMKTTDINGTVTYSNKISDTFSVKRKGPVVIITQKYIPDEPLEHPNAIGVTLQDKFPVEVYYSSNTIDSNVKKSAGDKVQDLIGIVSNAGKLTDLLRGIQIPYDSLVTSSGVTGVARNFFLTFGEIPITEKGSLANERSATQLMDEMILLDEWGGNLPDKGKRNIFDKLVEAVIPDDIQALSGWLVGAAKDMWVTLDSPAHGNAGGIRIIPEKLHVRYDAGNNYYAFNLELIASDFVIGV